MVGERKENEKNDERSAQVRHGVLRRLLDGFHQIGDGCGGVCDLVHAHLEEDDGTWIREIRSAGIGDDLGGLSVEGGGHRGDRVPDGGVRAEERRIEVGDWHRGSVLGVCVLRV